MCCALQKRVLGLWRKAYTGDGANSSGADEGSASEGSVAPAPVEVTPEVATASDVIEQEPLIIETTASVSADTEVSSKGDGVEPEATREEDEAAKQRTALKLRLLAQSAASNRGALATSWQKSDVEVIISELESRNPNRDVLQAKPSPLDGRWELVYSNVEQFRSSPFFWAFQEGLLEGNAAVAGAIFKFTDSIPGATVGRAIQQISLSDNLLVSEVDLEVFPRVSGTVITTCQVQASPVAANLLDVTVDNTRVSGENVLPFIQAVAVPVQDILERLRGPGATRVCMQLTYLDEELRVSRTQPDGNVFVYRRV